jgi:uncharacterized protein YceK
MKKIAVCLVAAIVFSGCASYMAVKSHDDAINQKAIMMRLDAQANGQPTLNVGIDLLNTKGYLGAWKESPGKMTLATILDAALAYGAYELSQSDDSSNPIQARGVVVDVSNNNSPVVVNIVSGDSNSSNNDENGTGTSNMDVND